MNLAHFTNQSNVCMANHRPGQQQGSSIPLRTPPYHPIASPSPSFPDPSGVSFAPSSMSDTQGSKRSLADELDRTASASPLKFLADYQEGKNNDEVTETATSGIDRPWVTVAMKKQSENEENNIWEPSSPHSPSASPAEVKDDTAGFMVTAHTPLLQRRRSRAKSATAVAPRHGYVPIRDK